jgi:hypothetical protein
MTKARFQAQAGGGESTRAIGFNEHLEFFDGNEDHKISLYESQKGLERLGFGRLLTVPAAFAINFGISGLCLLQGRLMNPANLELPRAGFVRHPDTDLIDDEGNFDDDRLDAVFAMYGKCFEGDALTMTELCTMVGRRLLEDAKNSTIELLLLPVGLMGVTVEWAALVWIAGSKRENHLVLEKDTVRRFYTDARFFHDIALRIAKERTDRSQSLLGMARNFIQDWVI